MSRPVPTEAEIAALTPRELARADIGGGTPRQRRRGIGPGQSKLPALAQEVVDEAKRAAAKSVTPVDTGS